MMILHDLIPRMIDVSVRENPFVFDAINVALAGFAATFTVAQVIRAAIPASRMVRARRFSGKAFAELRNAVAVVAGGAALATLTAPFGWYNDVLNFAGRQMYVHVVHAHGVAPNPDGIYWIAGNAAVDLLAPLGLFAVFTYFAAANLRRALADGKRLRHILRVPVAA